MQPHPHLLYMGISGNCSKLNINPERLFVFIFSFSKYMLIYMPKFVSNYSIKTWIFEKKIKQMSCDNIIYDWICIFCLIDTNGYCV